MGQVPLDSLWHGRKMSLSGKETELYTARFRRKFVNVNGSQTGNLNERHSSGERQGGGGKGMVA